jgi:hypothetical protein
MTATRRIFADRREWHRTFDDPSDPMLPSVIEPAARSISTGTLQPALVRVARHDRL